jgi:hypothetical protein
VHRKRVLSVAAFFFFLIFILGVKQATYSKITQKFEEKDFRGFMGY